MIPNDEGAGDDEIVEIVLLEVDGSVVVDAVFHSFLEHYYLSLSLALGDHPLPLPRQHPLIYRMRTETKKRAQCSDVRGEIVLLSFVAATSARHVPSLSCGILKIETSLFFQIGRAS